ncbi:putative acetyltransferase protein [Mycena chlorophos]|uniref:Putative acetyltransferase protein n=1 Tax=Mycena chlorophos TaxID=658473 RepID=A0A8H6SN67_MYCCL|nr:putative acetyltransferase protein [Mycena chlorophos]
MAFTIRAAQTPEDILATKALFRAYHQWLDIDLTFQDFETELASLPGKYASEKGGRILLAFPQGSEEPVGCIALRDITLLFNEWTGSQGTPHKKIGEVKRLYTLPSARGSGIGEDGYDELRLDTLPRMQGAIKLYSKVGFVTTDKYYDTDLEGTIFMKYTAALNK